MHSATNGDGVTVISGCSVSYMNIVKFM